MVQDNEFVWKQSQYANYVTAIDQSNNGFSLTDPLYQPITDHLAAS